jgi:hypothetical protein
LLLRPRLPLLDFEAVVVAAAAAALSLDGRPSIR